MIDDNRLLAIESAVEAAGLSYNATTERFEVTAGPEADNNLDFDFRGALDMIDAGVTEDELREYAQWNRTRATEMTGKQDDIYRPKGKEISRATLDIAGILFRCYDEELTPKEAIAECKRVGGTSTTLSEVESAYKRLDAVGQWLEEKIIPYLKQQHET